MKLKEQFETWNKDAGGNEDAVAKLHTELFAMVGCNVNEAEVEEPMSIWELDPGGGLLEDVDGQLVPKQPEQKSGWVVLMDQDAEGFNLFLDGAYKAHFGSSSRGATMCFGDLADGRRFKALVVDNITEGWKER